MERERGLRAQRRIALAPCRSCPPRNGDGRQGSDAATGGGTSIQPLRLMRLPLRARSLAPLFPFGPTLPLRGVRVIGRGLELLSSSSSAQPVRVVWRRMKRLATLPRWTGYRGNFSLQQLRGICSLVATQCRVVIIPVACLLLYLSFVPAAQRSLLRFACLTAPLPHHPFARRPQITTPRHCPAPLRVVAAPSPRHSRDGDEPRLLQLASPRCATLRVEATKSSDTEGCIGSALLRGDHCGCAWGLAAARSSLRMFALDLTRSICGQRVRPLTRAIHLRSSSGVSMHASTIQSARRKEDDGVEQRGRSDMGSHQGGRADASQPTLPQMTGLTPRCAKRTRSTHPTSLARSVGRDPTPTTTTHSQDADAELRA